MSADPSEPSTVMPDSFGARLRQHRESRDVSLAAIAERTKIKLSLLDGLERGDISRWPAGIFRRAYLRDYALAIGLDPETVMREFYELYPEPVEANDPPASPPPRFRSLVDTAFGSLGRLRRPPVIEPPRPPARAPIAAPVTVASAARRDPVDQASAAARPEPERASSEPADHVPAAVAAPPPIQPAGRIAAAEAVPTSGAVPAAPSDSEPLDLLAAARLCTELGRVDSAAQVQPLLTEAVRVLGAVGLIVWVWDEIASELRPALVHGYSERLLSQVPGVSRDADNVTAAAYRSMATLVVAGNAQTSGALALPLLTPGGCAGILAIELPQGREQVAAVRAVATFIAAMLAQLVGGAPPAESLPSAPEQEQRRA